MLLSVSASFQPNEDEVWVDFRSTENDGTTLSIADEVEVTLMMESTNLVGSVSYIPISKVKAGVAYLRPDKNFEFKFRNPPRRMDLWVEAKAKFGSINYQKRVLVGIADPSHSAMDLPDNKLFEFDVYEHALTGGGDFDSDTETFNDNTVILAPEIRDYIRVYDFSKHGQPEDFEGLVYLGGGNRLLLNNQSHQFDEQSLDQSYWDMSAYAFLEGYANNLLSNPFFQNVPSVGASYPVGYEVDSATALMQSSVDFDHKVTSSAKVWTTRLNMQNVVSGYNPAIFAHDGIVTVTAGTEYTFSTYIRIRKLTRVTSINRLTFVLKWYQGLALLSESVAELNPSDFSDLSIGQLTAIAPIGATGAVPEIRVGSIDSGDDVEVQLLGWQLEAGPYATSRTHGIRVADEVSIDSYNAGNQKVRLSLITGFASGISDQQLMMGPLEVTFTQAGDLEVVVGEASVTLTAPLSFAVGDPLDLTFEHQAGKKLSVYRDGQLLADTPLPDFAATPSPLTILGVGVELLKLSVFSRRGE